MKACIERPRVVGRQNLDRSVSNPVEYALRTVSLLGGPGVKIVSKPVIVAACAQRHRE